jgi:hypothetical protein
MDAGIDQKKKIDVLEAMHYTVRLAVSNAADPRILFLKSWLQVWRTLKC